MLFKGLLVRLGIPLSNVGFYVKQSGVLKEQESTSLCLRPGKYKVGL